MESKTRFSLKAGATALSLAGFFVVGVAAGQTTRGNIVGHVNDPGGAAIVGAGVELRNKRTGQTLRLVTDEQGDFTFCDGTTSLGAVPVDSNGRASFTTASLTAGNHTITATFGAAANYASGSSSVTITLVQ